MQPEGPSIWSDDPIEMASGKSGALHGFQYPLSITEIAWTTQPRTAMLPAAEISSLRPIRGSLGETTELLMHQRSNRN